MNRLIAELIFHTQANANAAEIALCEAGYVVEQRPDWDDCGGDCAWLTASTIADDVHAFAARVETIIKSYDGVIWVAGSHEFNAAYNDTLELTGYLQ